jgi:predicted transcriptional regulator
MSTQLLLTDAPAVDPLADERARIEAVIRETARACNGTVSSNDVREHLAGIVHHPRLVGQVYSALRRSGALVETGAERSTDTAGGNAGRWVPTYEWRGAL